MDIYAKKGDKVKVKTLNAGYKPDIELAKKHLVIGQVYTVKMTAIHNWKTDVYLQEIPGVHFNSVFFEDCNAETEIGQ